MRKHRNNPKDHAERRVRDKWTGTADDLDALAEYDQAARRVPTVVDADNIDHSQPIIVPSTMVAAPGSRTRFLLTVDDDPATILDAADDLRGRGWDVIVPDTFEDFEQEARDGCLMFITFDEEVAFEFLPSVLWMQLAKLYNQNGPVR